MLISLLILFDRNSRGISTSWFGATFTLSVWDLSAFITLGRSQRLCIERSQTIKVSVSTEAKCNLAMPKQELLQLFSSQKNNR